MSAISMNIEYINQRLQKVSPQLSQIKEPAFSVTQHENSPPTSEHYVNVINQPDDVTAGIKRLRPDIPDGFNNILLIQEVFSLTPIVALRFSNN